MIQQYSPNMLKTYELCPRKFYYKYVKCISMPTDDEIFEFGKNIHALASYYLKNQNIDLMEKSLSAKELDTWYYLKNTKYFNYDVIDTEYNLAYKIKDKFIGGRIDALVKNDDTFYILDYKTGSAPKVAKYDFQTMVYALCVSEFFNTNKIIFVYLDLKNKKDISIIFDEKLKLEYLQKLSDFLKKIEATDYSFIKRKNDCSCEYSILCF